MTRRVRSLVFVALAAALLGGACGGSSAPRGTPDLAPATSEPASSASPAPSASPRPSPSETATLDGVPVAAVHTLPPGALSTDALEPAGQATAGDGERIDLVHASSERVAPWEWVSATADGWLVWLPRVVVDAVAHAGPDASVVDAERVDWPDACLGAAQPGEVCAQVITPGYRVRIQRNGSTIEYHTGLASGLRPVAP